MSDTDRKSLALYNSSIHQDPSKVKEKMMIFLKKEGVVNENGEYRLDLGQCELYLANIFTNLPTRTIKYMMDQLILSGEFITERNEDYRWIVVIKNNSWTASYREKEREKVEEFPKKNKLRNFLKESRVTGQKIDLVNFTYFCRLLTGALAEDRRWKQYSGMCRDYKFSKTGEALSETILEHTGIDTPLLGGMMLAMEQKMGTILSYDILPVTFFLHDLPEGIALAGDVDYTLKSAEVDDEEDDAFGLMMDIFSPEARAYFEKAYAIVRESGRVKRAGLSLEEASLNAQFFTAVEIVGYLSRALYEVKVGNIIFGNTFWNHCQFENYFRKKFVSFEELVGPHVKFMDEFRKEHQGSEWQKELEKNKKS